MLYKFCKASHNKSLLIFCLQRTLTFVKFKWQHQYVFKEAYHIEKVFCLTAISLLSRKVRELPQVFLNILNSPGGADLQEWHRMAYLNLYARETMPFHQSAVWKIILSRRHFRNVEKKTVLYFYFVIYYVSANHS